MQGCGIQAKQHPQSPRVWCSARFWLLLGQRIPDLNPHDKELAGLAKRQVVARANMPGMAAECLHVQQTW